MHQGCVSFGHRDPGAYARVRPAYTAMLVGRHVTTRAFVTSVSVHVVMVRSPSMCVVTHCMCRVVGNGDAEDRGML